MASRSSVVDEYVPDVRDYLTTARDRVSVGSPVRRHATGVGIFLFVYAFLLRNVRLGRLYAFGDFPPYYGTRALSKFVGHWHEGNLGFSYIYHVLPGYIGVITVVGDAVGGVLGLANGGILAQNLFYLGLLPVCYVGFLVFVGRFVDELPARHVAAGLYAVNPVTIAEFVNGGLSTLVAFAGLPFVLHFLWRVVERDSWRPALLGAVAFGATSISAWLAFWMVAPFAAVLAYRARGSWSRLSKLVVSGLLGTFLTLPSLHHVLQRAGQFDTSGGSLSNTLFWNYQDATLLPVLRLAGNNGTLAMNILGYNQVDGHLAGLVVPLVALVAWHRRDLHPFFAVAAGTAGFILATGAGLTWGLFDPIPILYSVRNPVKLQAPMTLAVAVLFGAGVGTLLAVVPRVLRRTATYRELPDDVRRQAVRVAVVGLVVVSLVAYAAPASGALGLEQVRGDSYYVNDGQVAVADRLDGRVLWVPYGYTTQLRLRHVYPDHVGIKSGGAFHGIQNREHVEQFFEDFVEDPASTRSQLTSMGVRYVVVSRDAPRRDANGHPRVIRLWGTPWLKGNPVAYEADLRTSSVFRQAFETDDGAYAVYEVVGVNETQRVERVEGVHTLYYPRSTEGVEYEANLLSNPDFDDGLRDWWHNGTDTEYAIVDDGVRLRTIGNYTYPVAQRVSVQPGRHYRVDVGSDAPVSVQLVWYEDPKSPDNYTGDEVYEDGDLPALVEANSSVVSVRVRPAEQRAVVDNVSVRPRKHPPETGFVGAGEAIPGVAIDGWEHGGDLGTTVSVNLVGWKADELDPDVRLVDAETRLGGHLVYDDTYRQGAGVLLSDTDDDGAPDLPAGVPDEARVVTHQTNRGTVLDYWVLGEFDDTRATVLRESYDERWRSTTGGAHFEADGWANGYLDTDPEDIRWTGGSNRGLIVGLWVALWVGTLGVLAVVTIRSRWT